MIQEEGRHGPCCPSPPCKRLNAGYKPQSVDSTDAWHRQLKNWLPFFSPEPIKLAGSFPEEAGHHFSPRQGSWHLLALRGISHPRHLGTCRLQGKRSAFRRTQEYPGKRSPHDPVITSGHRNRLHDKHGGAMPAPPAQGAEERRKTCPREPVPSAKQPAQNGGQTRLRFERRCILRLQRTALAVPELLFIFPHSP